MVSFWCVHYGSSNRNIVLVAEDEEDEERKRSAVESVGERKGIKERMASSTRDWGNYARSPCP